VAVLDQAVGPSIYRQRHPDDYAIEWYSGSGAGGQHRNKHQNSARITHLPTGIIRSAQTRSRENSLKLAMDAITMELNQRADITAGQAVNAFRRDQVGSGERSDKRRTLRFQEGIAIDHDTGKRMPVDAFMKGNMDKLWRD
jgi:peptide chain release factor 1